MGQLNRRIGAPIPWLGAGVPYNTASPFNPNFPRVLYSDVPSLRSTWTVRQIIVSLDAMPWLVTVADQFFAKYTLYLNNQPLTAPVQLDSTNAAGLAALQAGYTNLINPNEIELTSGDQFSLDFLGTVVALAVTPPKPLRISLQLLGTQEIEHPPIRRRIA